MSHQPVKKIKTTLFVVWTVPLIALFFAAFFVYKYYDNRGVDIIVTFNDGSGLNVRKTHLMYKGIAVGVVSNIKVHSNDMSKIDVTITVDKRAARTITREGTKFYKVEPKVSLTEISGLKAIIGGVYIDVYPAKAELNQILTLPIKNKFTAVNHKPIDLHNPGLYFTLLDKAGKFRKGTPIIYKNFEIGSIIESQLLADGVKHRVMIQRKYAHFIKEDSKFFGAKALDVKASLTGINVEVDSLAALIAGGIKFTSPEKSPELNSSDGYFELYKSKVEMVCDLETITLIAKGGYNLDAKFNQVLFKGVNAGNIEYVHYNPLKDETEIDIKLKKEFRPLLDNGAYFWIVQPKASLDGVSGLDAIVKGNYITFKKSDDNPISINTYPLHVTPPKLKGKEFSLYAAVDSSISKGSKIYYHTIEVGVIDSVALHVKDKRLKIQATIMKKYASLINDSTLFYHLGAIEADVNLEGVHVKASPLDSMLRGGISFKTPKSSSTRNKKTFTLFNALKDVNKKIYLSSGGSIVTLYSEKSKSLLVGSPVLYEGFKVGEVTDINYDNKSELFSIALYIEKAYSNKINATTRFYNSSALKIKADLSSGLQVELASASSLVTGSVSFSTLHTKADKKNSFILYETKEDPYKTHTAFTFSIDDASALSDSSKIQYRGLQIGYVVSRTLKADGVEIKALIDNKYTSLFVEDTRIWLEGFKVSMKGVSNASSLVSGSFITLRKGASTTPKRAFKIEEKPLHVKENEKGLHVRLEALRRSSIKRGTPLFFRQVQIGFVESVSLKSDSSSVQIKAFIEACYAHLIRENSIFYNATAIGVDVSLLGVKVSTETVETMISGGIAVVTPNDYTEAAKDNKMFKLFNEPDEDWLEYSAHIDTNTSICQ